MSSTRGWTHQSDGLRPGGRPDYLIVATNVRLSGVPAGGGIDRVRTLLKHYAGQLGLRDICYVERQHPRRWKERRGRFANTREEVVAFFEEASGDGVPHSDDVYLDIFEG